MAKKAKKPSNSENDKSIQFIDRGFMPAVILTIIAIISVALLALTEYVTADARAKQIQYMEDANKRIIFTEADSFPAEDLENVGASLEGGNAVDLSGEGSLIQEVFLVEEDGETVGILITANPVGYGGAVGLMLGYDLEGNSVGLTIDASTQTAGLGDRVAKDEEFTQQFSGFNARDNISTTPNAGFEVDVISGATVSSNAVIKGINAANEAVSQMLGLR